MKVCPNCASTFDDSMRFCVQCGTALVDAAAPVEEAPATEVQPVVEQPAPAQSEAPQPEAQFAAAQPAFEQGTYAAPIPGYAPQYQAPVAPAPNPADHTAEFDAEDIAKNKLYAMLIYLLGPIGIVIALLTDKESGFLQFHIKLSIKYLVVQTILLLATTILCWTFIVPIGGCICICIVSILEIITFVQVCKGQAKDPAIIKNIKFLN